MRFALIAVLMLSLASVSTAATSGVVGATPRPRPGEDFDHFVATRFRAKVGPRSTGRDGKVLFVSMGVHGPAGPRSYSIQTNLHSYHFEQTDGMCERAMLPAYPVKPWTTMTFADVDYPRTRETGLRINEAGFPRVAGLVDGIDDLWIMGAAGSDLDLTNQEISVWVFRGDTFTDDLDDWGFGCRADGRLQPGTRYIRWYVVVTTPKGTFGATYAFPEMYAEYVLPVHVLTEFFNQPGFYQVFFWDAEAQREGSDAWERLPHWELNFPPQGPGSPADRGVRYAIVDGHPAVEVSNDGTPTYLGHVGDAIDLP